LIDSRFFVRSLETAGNLSLSGKNRVHSSAPIKANGITENIVQLAVEKDGLKDEAVLYFGANANKSFDPTLDALKLISPDPDAIRLYFNDDTYKFAINVIPDPGTEAVGYHLNFVANKDAYYTINVTKLAFPYSTPVYLKDKKTGTITHLQWTKNYLFEYKTTDDPYRFDLYFNNTVTNLDDDWNKIQIENVNVFSVDDKVYIELPEEKRAKVEIYNVLGARILTSEINDKGRHEIPVTSGSGYYLVKLQQGASIYSKGVFLK